MAGPPSGCWRTATTRGRSTVPAGSWRSILRPRTWCAQLAAAPESLRHPAVRRRFPWAGAPIRPRGLVRELDMRTETASSRPKEGRATQALLHRRDSGHARAARPSRARGLRRRRPDGRRRRRGFQHGNPPGPGACGAADRGARQPRPRRSRRRPARRGLRRGGRPAFRGRAQAPRPQSRPPESGGPRAWGCSSTATPTGRSCATAGTRRAGCRSVAQSPGGCMAPLPHDPRPSMALVLVRDGEPEARLVFLRSVSRRSVEGAAGTIRSAGRQATTPCPIAVAPQTSGAAARARVASTTSTAAPAGPTMHWT